MVQCWPIPSGRSTSSLRRKAVTLECRSTWLEAGYQDDCPEEELLSLKGHASGVLCLAISRDGKRFVSGSWDNTLKGWDADKGPEVLSLKRRTSTLGCVAEIKEPPDVYSDQ
jgi:WD40 repeat protein